MMGTLLWRTKFIATAAALVILSGCGVHDGKSPEEWFQFTWSGLAGSDALTFHGYAALQRGNKAEIEESWNYTGQLKGHHYLSMRTLTPQEVKTNHMQMAKLETATDHELNLRWQDGNWKLQGKDGDALASGMSRLNPLDQLEEIWKTKKMIRAENGAARGTKVLRIELDPAEAKQRIAGKLQEEMKSLKTGWSPDKLSELSPKRREQTKNELEKVWDAGNEQLGRKLKAMDARVVYHLTINIKTGLPQRLTSDTRIVYPSSRGTTENEVLFTDNRFGKYR